MSQTVNRVSVSRCGEPIEIVSVHRHWHKERVFMLFCVTIPNVKLPVLVLAINQVDCFCAEHRFFSLPQRKCPWQQLTDRDRPGNTQ